jgi:uncharacterized membrane protein YgcG
LLIAILIVLNAGLHGQSVKGKLLDLIDNKPLVGATLRLTSLKDSAQQFNAISDSSGRFEFRNLYSDSFTLKVSFIGYEDFRQIVGVKDTVVDLGALFIPKSIKELGEVTVNVRTPPTTQKGDTTQYNASQFKVNPDATTEDLVKKMPGVTVEKDGTVTAQGEQVRKVTIDGREFFGDDATAALRNLPAEIVDKIQVFDRLSDQAQFTGFDDGNSQRTINIVTKSGIKNGQFGRIYGGYGTNDRYSAGGNVSFFKNNRRLSFVGNFNNINQQNFAGQDLLGVSSNTGNRGGGGNFGGGGGGNRGGGGNFGGGGNRGGGGGFGFNQSENFTVGQQPGISKTNAIGVNFSDKWGKKIDAQGSYFFNNSENDNAKTLKSQTTFADKTQFTDQASNSLSKNYNHRINMRIEYRIDSSNSLIINPSLNFQKNNSLSHSVSQTYYGAGDTVNTSDNITKSHRDGYNLRNNILYRHAFAKRGRSFSINLNTTLNKNDGESYVISHYRFFDGGVIDSLQNQFTTNPTNGYSIASNVAYTEPIGKKGQLQINYLPSYSKSKADQQTFRYDPAIDKYSRFDSSLSNRFTNETIAHNGGISYRLGTTRDNQFSIGVNIQHSELKSDRIFPTVTQVDQAFTTLLPNLMWRKKISLHSNFNIFYRANTNFPSITQLQDVVNTNNPLRVSSGNPDLKQSYTHFLSGRYTFTNTQKGQSFFANIFMQAAQDYISNATFRAVNGDSIIQKGITLKEGSQLTKPVNLDGYKSFRSFFTYSMPVKFIKSNLNLSTGFIYSKLPGMVNYLKTMTNNYTYNTGVVIASNISEYIDFNLSYNANFNYVTNSAQDQDDRYVNQAAGLQLSLLTKTGWFVQNDLSNQTYSGLSSAYNQSYWLWNAAIGKKFLKNKTGELKLSAFDLLKQNQSIVRTVQENYVEDSQTKVLQQYFMLTFTYSLKNFGKPPARNFERRGGDRMPAF